MYVLVLVSFTYTPSLSASGSVARIICASTFWANSKANLNAFLSSGLGYSTVGKFPSGSCCSFTIFIFLKY